MLRPYAAVCIGCLLALGIAACAGRGGSPPKPPADPGSGGSGTIDFERDVQPIFDVSCSCHLTLTAPEGAVLQRGLSYDSLVNVASTQNPSLPRVKPKDPASSYLFIKIDPGPESASRRSGDLMPLQPPALGADQVKTIRLWIEEGALRAVPSEDVRPPTFAGLGSAVAAGPFSADLAWTGAVDDTSAPGEITYLLYSALAAGAEDFMKPLLATPRGALSVHVDGLAPATTHFFILRARDAAGNVDPNRVEVSVTTLEGPGPGLVDFDLQVLPIFQENCIRCHGTAPGGCAGYGGLCLDCPSGIESAVTSGVIVRGNSAQSRLVLRIHADASPRMPLDGPPFLTDEEIGLIGTWIDEGALRAPPPGGNRPPVARAGGPYQGYAQEPIAFAALEAYDADCDALTFTWDFGDGEAGAGRFPQHTYAREGLYTAFLTAGDGKATSTVSAAAVTVLSPGAGVPRSPAVERPSPGSAPER